MINTEFPTLPSNPVLKHRTQTKREKKSPEKQKSCRQMHRKHPTRPPFGLILTHFSLLLI